jgi:methionyl-tRNA synthetase
MPEQKDSEFTWAGFQESNNNELVNNLANFINRVVVLTNKYYDGIVPDFDPDVHINDLEDEMELSFHDNEILRLFDDLDKVSEYIRKFEFRAALKKIMEISSKGNQLLQANEPWKIQKEDPETVKNVMNIALQYVAALSHIIKPFLPFTSDKIQDLLNLPHLKEHGELLNVMNLLAEGEVVLEAGHKINKSNHLFSRIEDDKIEEQVQKLKDTEKVEASTSESNGQDLLPISFEDFTKLDIRIGTIVSAEKVKKANKLLCLQVDIKDDQRTVVSGIAEHYDPAHIIGQQVILLTNLAPRKIKGIESQGMILMAEDGNGSLKFIQPSEAITNGARVS